ncbi:MAG: right-handed parallel beta-helix repeat-containing protein [Armatimonadetes bacterium]|nr:right-handed parallel beta-helix repeat-containing protein [Armatimonadota bacterium]NCP30223.1 right-handed parallel beta-helix repeat-containing protein [Armatimonadota bacterium]
MLIKTGVYREHAEITVSGAPGKPLTFAAAPGHRVVIKGSEIVRGFGLTASKVHDVVLRGLEVRHNRQPGGQWPLAAISGCEWVTLEDCEVHFADFCGLSLHSSKDCLVRRCDFSHNGAIGLAMGATEDCVVEDCTLMFNNYRRIDGDWGVAAGTKNIPGNKRTTMRRCEAAYNLDCRGIWFDTDNDDIRILDNVCHHNGDCGIFFEINKGGGVIAGNLIYANTGRGIYVSGSQNTWVVNNAVADNAAGIVVMTRGADEPAKNTKVLNNLLLKNYITADTTTRGCGLTLEMSPDPTWRADMGSVADYNVYANNPWTPFMRHTWNDNNPLAQWQARYQQDLHSRLLNVAYERVGTRFSLLTQEGLDAAAPLPEAVTQVWKPRNPKRVGADLTQWPKP